MQTSELQTCSQINTNLVKFGIVSNLRRLDTRLWASPVKTQEHEKERLHFIHCEPGCDPQGTAYSSEPQAREIG